MYIRAGCIKSRILKAPANYTSESYAQLIESTGTPGLVLLSFTGNWRSFFNEIANHSDSKTLVIVTGINNNNNSRLCWKEIVGNEKSIVTFDLYYCGIVFFDKKRYKQHYIVNF